MKPGPSRLDERDDSTLHLTDSEAMQCTDRATASGS